MLASTGCVASFPKRVQSVTSPDGLTHNRLVKAGGITLLSSAAWLPGTPAVGLQFAQWVSCATPVTLMQVTWRSALFISGSDASEVCRLALAAGEYLLEHIPGYDVPIEPQLYLAPNDDGIQRSAFSIHPPESLEPVFVFRWYPDDRRMRAEIVDTVAHELFHLRAAMRGKSRHSRTEERAAYLVGACAQLDVNGAIFVNSIIAGKVPDSIPPGPDRISMEAARARAEELYLFFDDDGWIRASGNVGQQLLARCESELAAWFATPD